MTLLDFLVALILVGSIASGFVAGFIRVGVGFVAAICGIVGGFWFYGVAAAWIQPSVHSTLASNLLGFFIILFLCLVAGALIGKLLAMLFRSIGLSMVDRALGGCIGLVRGVLVVIALVAVLMAFVPKPLPNWMVNSKSLPYAIDASHLLSQLAPKSVKDAFNASMQEVEQTWSFVRKARATLPGFHERGRRKDRDEDKR